MIVDVAFAPKEIESNARNVGLKVIAKIGDDVFATEVLVCHCSVIVLYEI